MVTIRNKVIAGQKLESADKFSRKNGFAMTKQITIHGNESSNLYVKELYTGITCLF